MCGIQSVPWSWPWVLALAPAGDLDSQAHGKMTSSLFLMITNPHVKEITCPLSYRASKAWGFWVKRDVLCPQTSSPHLLH